MTEKKKKTANARGFISNIPASMDEVIKALLEPNYSKVQKIKEQKSKKGKK